MSQHIQSSQIAPQLSPEAYQFTAAYQLGTPTAEYEVKRTFGNRFVGVPPILIGIFLLVVGIGFVILGVLQPSSMRWVGFIMGPLLILIGLLTSIGWYTKRNLRIYVCTDGLVQVNGNDIRAIRWDEIESVHRRVTKHYTNGIYMRTSYLYTVRGSNGTRFMFNDMLENIEKLGNTLEYEVTRRQLPKAIAAYNAGIPLNFGKLTISQQGVSNGKETLLWSQVQGIQANKGVISIKKEGKWLNWSTVRASMVPNIFVFLALVDYIMQSQRH